MDQTLKDTLINHLEFLGYKKDPEDIASQALYFKHERFYNFVLQELNGGILLSSGFGEVANGDDVRGKALEKANEVNSKTSTAVCYVSPSHRVLLTAWYALPYNKDSFAVFAERWQSDGRTFASGAFKEVLNLDEPVGEIKASSS